MEHFQEFTGLHLFHLYFLFITFFSSPAQSQKTTPAILSTDPSYYYNLCATSVCNNISLIYPFGLAATCRQAPIEMFCPNNEKLLVTTPSNSDTFRVLSFNFTDPNTTTIFAASDSLFTCGAQSSKPDYKNYGAGFALLETYAAGTHLNCTAPILSKNIQGLQNASCLGCNDQDQNSFCYYAPGFVKYNKCETFDVFTLGGPLNATSVGNLRVFPQSGFEMRFEKPMKCRGCEASGGRCGSNPISGLFVCYCPSAVHPIDCFDGTIQDLSTWASRPMRGRSGPSRVIVSAIISGASALIVGIIIAFLVVFRKQKKGFNFSKETISSISQRRYSYSQLKKFTNNFSMRVGEGGSGTVYKGIVHQSGLEISVAVKILKQSRQTKKQFVNEVATVGSIHHHNLVALLGYCVEGETHALVYEFMENGSLDKYVYNILKERRLSFKQVSNIALETARGVLYLHKGCNKKIVHCDIKPPNILLDSNFSAKVSDFGLARMTTKDQSHFSLTEAQGTPGYAAPEVWLKGHGPVTEKADVYGYGMVLLEMLGGRKNYDAGASGSDQIYFPEWLHKKIEKEELPLLIREKDGDDPSRETVQLIEEEEKSVQRMCFVGLWCIQHNPLNRPSMDRVVQMLEGQVEIAIPPNPFPQNKTRSPIRASALD